jgi:hypothetical protein
MCRCGCLYPLVGGNPVVMVLLWAAGAMWVISITKLTFTGHSLLGLAVNRLRHTVVGLRARASLLTRLETLLYNF